MQLFAQPFPERFDLNIGQVLALKKHFRERDRKTGLNRQPLGVTGFTEVFFGQQPSANRFVTQRLIIMFQIRHHSLSGRKLGRTAYRFCVSGKSRSGGRTCSE